MSATRIVLVEPADRRRHVLSLAHASATAELVTDWATRRVESSSGGGSAGATAPVRLPSLRDFVGDRSDAA